MAEFLSMSGYGEYVWSAYGLGVAVLVWNAWSARRAVREQLARMQRRAQMEATP